MANPALKRIGWGVGVAAAMFVGLGTAAALWDNPRFMRMTPTGGFEITLLLLLSALAGLYVGLPQAECGKRTAGTGGVIGFLGIACGLRIRSMRESDRAVQLCARWQTWYGWSCARTPYPRRPPAGHVREAVPPGWSTRSRRRISTSQAATPDH